MVILSLGEAASVGLRWAKRLADGCSWDVLGGGLRPCLASFWPWHRPEGSLVFSVGELCRATTPMATILLTADVFGMFTPCQALGLEPYGALRGRRYHYSILRISCVKGREEKQLAGEPWNVGQLASGAVITAPI